MVEMKRNSISCTGTLVTPTSHVDLIRLLIIERPQMMRHNMKALLCIACFPLQILSLLKWQADRRTF